MTINPLTNTLLFLFLASLLSVLTTAPAQAANAGPFVSDPKVRGWASHLCRLMGKANATGKDIVKTMEDQMLTHLGLSRATPNYQDKLIAFYNANHHDFICKGKVTEKTRETEHIMKRALALSIHNKVFAGFFFDTEDRDFDFNAVEWVIKDPEARGRVDMHNVTHAPWGNGTPETVVDYLDKILADPEASNRYVISDIVSLREALIEEFSAKTAKELGY